MPYKIVYYNDQFDRLTKVIEGTSLKPKSTSPEIRFLGL